MNISQTKAIEAEFSRLVVADKIKSLGLREKISANADERKALVERLGINDLHSLQFDCELMPWKKGGARLKGVVNAEIEEICVVSLEPFKTRIKEPVERVFTHPTKSNPSEDVLDLENLDEDLPDNIVDGTIDIGEVAVESLALTLASYPRKPGVEFSDHLEFSTSDKSQAPVQKNPFDVLKNLKTD